MKQLTLANIRSASPFPWETQVNFNGMGGVRMIDATGKEVPLLNITAFSGIMTAMIAATPAPTPQEAAA
ncbi:hypothetical protein [Burkholderia vietnamiensis]|uniref:hypothetical protein n=1 Tax=Burkholderia vietnamiensis TaxID=60552 RepID=UPI001CABE8DF|nr:hypothetical protein [Burkholderia vietnamiensis]CAG9229028.1 conserved hypothetical protein [Burkholderia vietnamiensis]